MPTGKLPGRVAEGSRKGRGGCLRPAAELCDFHSAVVNYRGRGAPQTERLQVVRPGKLMFPHATQTHEPARRFREGSERAPASAARQAAPARADGVRPRTSLHRPERAQVRPPNLKGVSWTCRGRVVVVSWACRGRVGGVSGGGVGGVWPSLCCDALQRRLGRLGGRGKGLLARQPHARRQLPASRA